MKETLDLKHTHNQIEIEEHSRKIFTNTINTYQGLHSCKKSPFRVESAPERKWTNSTDDKIWAITEAPPPNNLANWTESAFSTIELLWLIYFESLSSDTLWINC